MLGVESVHVLLHYCVVAYWYVDMLFVPGFLPGFVVLCLLTEIYLHVVWPGGVERLKCLLVWLMVFWWCMSIIGF